MRVLHVGWGFAPWREGGLIDYTEDLMDAQVERGHEVAYFFSGRHYPYLPGPRLKRWTRGGVAMHEMVNGPLIPGMEKGTRHPERELSEPRVEAGFRRVLDAVQPDLVHIQELHALPSSLIDVVAAERVPQAMTLHDYGPLCTTLRLFDAAGERCMRRDVGADCAARNRDAPADPAEWVDMTVRFELRRARQLLGLDPEPCSVLGRAVRAAARRAAIPGAGRRGRDELGRSPEGQSTLESAFQRRRDVNVERLGRIDRLIAQSPRLAEIYRSLGVPGGRMLVLPGPARHIERLRPRRLESPPSPVTFATLNGFASPSKGSATVLAALRSLRASGLEGSFRLRVLGHVQQRMLPELRGYEGVELRGLYARDRLDVLLDDVDVGIVPSMWEEAYGYTGLELLAKGIPLIANPLGGIVQYAHEGRTAWLNAPCSGQGLAELMTQVVRDPASVVDMHRRVLAARAELIPSWDDHADRLEEVYRDLTTGG